MLKKALSFELLKALVEEAGVYKAFCVQLLIIDDRLTKLKCVQFASGSRSYGLGGLKYLRASRKGVRRPLDKRRVHASHTTVEESSTCGKEDFRRSPRAGKRLAPAKIRRQELEEVGRQQFEDKRMMDAILVPAMIDNIHNISAMVDSGLCHHAMIKSSIVRRLNLQRTPLPKPRPLAGFDGPREARTHFMVKFDLDVGGHQRKNVYTYEVDYDLMLGISWLAEQGILLDARNRTLIKSLPPLRGPGIDHTDHKIELEKKDGKTPEPPWGPLYNMSRDETLLLRKPLHDGPNPNYMAHVVGFVLQRGKR
ncbi:hypothetical protein ACJ73_09766 [Blastomyces percursus]|uniref:Uncharacterized protein n=1 Tax=Blastomyces percursus TaxID=1658174 RepID=A0A1J9P2D5_9EURO|nr:hypothetical protein ACJ73_09766 [Blastomyces percursus]